MMNCGGCPDLGVLGKGSQILRTCRVTGSSEDYGSECDLKIDTIGEDKHDSDQCEHTSKVKRV